MGSECCKTPELWVLKVKGGKKITIIITLLVRV